MRIGVDQHLRRRPGPGRAVLHPGPRLPGQDQRPYRPDERWLTVVSPEEPTGSSWRCIRPTRHRGRSSRPAASRPVLSLRTDDCQREAARLKAKGVGSSPNPRGGTTAASTRSSPSGEVGSALPRRDRRGRRRPDRLGHRDALVEFIDAARWTDRPRTRPASPPPGATAPRSSRSPAASTSTTSPTRRTGVRRPYPPAR
jgi:hypothetical protein